MKFFDEQSGATICMDRYYGFGDSGYLAGSFSGYSSREDAQQSILNEDPDVNIGLTPEQLGDTAVCILSGQEYVDRLRTLDPEDPDHINTYGNFVE